MTEDNIKAMSAKFKQNRLYLFHSVRILDDELSNMNQFIKKKNNNKKRNSHDFQYSSKFAQPVGNCSNDCGVNKTQS